MNKEDHMSSVKPPKGYVIAMVSVTDMDAYKPYMAQTSALVAEYGGKYIIRADQDRKENPAHDRFVAIEFESHDQANAFYNDERYARPARSGRTFRWFVFTIEA